MSLKSRTKALAAAIILVCATVAFGYDPPKGAIYLPSIYSPWALSGGTTVTGEASPWASVMNPSVLAGSQLTQVQAGYTGISDFTAGGQGWGSAASLAFALPVTYGVWGGEARFFSAPGSMTSMPLGTFGGLRASFSKALLPQLYVGSAVELTMGGNTSFGWGLGADLGATWFVGDLGFLKNSRLGFSLQDIGKGYSTTPLTGIFSGAASSYPSAFTFGAGIRGYLLQSYNWKIDAALDLRTPSFQDLDANLGFGFSFRDFARLNLSWDIGLRDVIAGSGRSFLPSLGLSGSIPLDKGFKLGTTQYRDATLGLSLAMAPLYDSLFATGAGVGLSFGLRDKTSPIIEATLPVSLGGVVYISPNSAQDTLTIPIKITDDRYIAGWRVTIEDKSSGKVIRTFGESNDRLETLKSLDDVKEALKFTLTDVNMPTEVVWDGRDNSGRIVADGPYTVSIVAWDDNGNINLDFQSCMTVVVDGKLPQATIKPLDDKLIFSPDGDGSKDSLSFRNTGTVENRWKIEIKDASGKVVRSQAAEERSAPRDFTWDGTANDGSRVLDGIYAISLVAKDEAGNLVSSTVKNLRVDTRRPTVSIATDESVMSPNADGVKDSLKIQTAVEYFDGLESWKVFVLDPDRKEVWSIDGKGDSKPEKTYVFGGLSSKGEPLADGQYEAGIELRYENGYSPQKLSSPFYMDKTPPSATIALADANRIFSPDSDGSRDSFAFDINSSEEDGWNLIIRDSGRNEKVVKRYSPQLPSRYEWDGRDDQGKVVADGEYEVYVFAVDRAGNSFSTASSRIRVDTRKPKAMLSIDREAFSPNSDGVAESMKINASSESYDGLASWKFSIADASGKTRFEDGGTEGSLPAREYVFTGKDGSEANLPEGLYKAKLELSYVNGFSTSVLSPSILLDRTFPSAKVSLDKSIFNPAGNAEQSRLAITQSGSDEDEWLASMTDGKGVQVRRWRFEGPLQNLSWDGTGDNGRIVPDGTYRYVVSATDRAGNSFATKEALVEVDTQKKESNLAADTLAFSPNGDGIKDKLTFRLEATASNRLALWTLDILGSAQVQAGGSPVKSWKGDSKLPSTIEWNGKQDSGLEAPDGLYAARLSLRYPNGDTSSALLDKIVLDRIAPSARVSMSATLFSPNGDGVLDVVRIDQTSIPGDTWQGTITTASGEAVRKWNWQGNVEGITWDGKDESGALVGDGTFYYELKSSDSSGNSFSSGKLPIAVETEKKAVRLSLDQRAFSPNGDGLRDTLALGATVQFPERVKSYELVIVAQEGAFAMNAVRTWKGSGSVPTKFTWAGETDSGIPAPDGRYAASLAVVYANGDSVDASTPVFIIDRVFPKIQTALSQEIFSPNGDGRSDTVEIKQTSMPGDDWTGKIFASDGSVVKTLSWKSEAKSFIWDGRDDTGGLVRDGTYRYVAEASDVAGNRSVSTPLSVTVDTEKKTVRIDADTLAFSPNGDGVRDSVNFGVAAQSRDKILKWSLEILPMNAASASLPVKTWSGPGTISERFTWDGGTDSGLAAPDGRYVAKLVILYANDDRFEREAGPILLDRVPPQATVRASASIFSPNGDGRSDTVQIFQESVPGDDWQGLMIATGNRIVRAWTWKNKVESFIWDGKDGSGIVVADGSYEYELRSVDAADNSFISPRIKLVIDASKKNVRFEVDQKAFSPNGDGIKDKLFLNIQAPRTEAIKEFEAAIFSVNASGVRNQNAVRTWRGDKNLQDQYAWDGTTDSGIAAPDGNYQATLKIVYENDDLFNLSSGLILLDTVAPRISLSAEPLLFSPNGDGNRDEIRFRQSSSAGDDWTGRVKNAAGTTIKTWTWRNEAKDFIWDGKDSSGTVVRDGIYSYEVGAVDQAGNAASARIANIQVDAAKPKVYVTASDSGMSPNGDGIRDEVSFTIVVERREGIESWRFSLMDKQGVEKSFFGGSDSEVPARLVWDGRDLQGQVVQGEYTGKLVVRYAKGDIAQAASTPVLVDVDPPKVDITVTPEYFSPDGDGASDVLSFDIAVDNNSGIIDWKLEVFETAIVESSSPGAVGSERLFMEWSGKGKPLQRITWDGKSSRGELVESATDYPFKFVARDALGNTTTVSGFIAVDVLVIRDGDRLKIKVPSIVFRANYPDFVGLSADIIARNEKVVARIAQILNKFPDYRIRIEGHANNIGKMLGYTTARIQAEETRELIPLSTGRAELVRTMLVQNGVDARRLSVQGLGSSEPVVSFTDVENRWKNRRVEFVLIKNQ